MKNLLIGLLLLVVSNLQAQDVKVLLKEADNFERSLKEDNALDKYKQVLTIEPTNFLALTKSAELSSGIGARQVDKKVKKNYYEAARTYADKARAINANSAEANYVRALVAGKLTEIETDNKKLVAHVKDIKDYADKALAIDPNHARANYVLGKWHFEMVNLSWVKKAAVKVLYGGLQDGTIENAIRYFEKSRQLDKYFVLGHLDLAKAYKYDDKPAKAIEILNLLVKLPNRTADDARLKEEGRKILSEMQ
jgi:predicted Zn-dependent protease